MLGKRYQENREKDETKAIYRNLRSEGMNGQPFGHENRVSNSPRAKVRSIQVKQWKAIIRDSLHLSLRVITQAPRGQASADRATALENRSAHRRGGLAKKSATSWAYKCPARSDCSMHATEHSKAVRAGERVAKRFLTNPVPSRRRILR